MPPPAVRLRELPLAARGGLSFLLLTLLGGFAASAAHLVSSHAGRDDRPGLSLDDLRGAYHGVRASSPMLAALERGHPSDLSTERRRALVAWLRGSRVNEDFDNPELGDSAPAEVLARGCLSCHSRRASGGEEIGQRIPLDYWDDVRKVAFSRDLRPTPLPILAASTHTHALALGALTIVLGALALGTSWPRRVVHAAVFLLGLTLFVDLGAWWLARGVEAFVVVLVVAGVLYNALAIASIVGVLVDLWRPNRPAAPPSRSA